VWGPASSTSIDGSRYYAIFVYHFSKYIWFYLMVKKFDVSIIFSHFKKFVETRFQTKIKSLYSANGGEFITLRSIFSTNRISHYTTAPHTSTIKWCHWTLTSSSCWNRSYITSWCQTWSFLLTTCVSHSLLSY